jgi:hypothetical protein
VATKLSENTRGDHTLTLVQTRMAVTKPKQRREAKELYGVKAKEASDSKAERKIKHRTIGPRIAIVDSLTPNRLLSKAITARAIGDPLYYYFLCHFEAVSASISFRLLALVGANANAISFPNSNALLPSRKEGFYAKTGFDLGF